MSLSYNPIITELQNFKTLLQYAGYPADMLDSITVHSVGVRGTNGNSTMVLKVTGDLANLITNESVSGQTINDAVVPTEEGAKFIKHDYIRVDPLSHVDTSVEINVQPGESIEKVFRQYVLSSGKETWFPDTDFLPNIDSTVKFLSGRGTFEVDYPNNVNFYGRKSIKYRSAYPIDKSGNTTTGKPSVFSLFQSSFGNQLAETKQYFARDYGDLNYSQNYAYFYEVNPRRFFENQESITRGIIRDAAGLPSNLSDEELFKGVTFNQYHYPASDYVGGNGAEGEPAGSDGKGLWTDNDAYYEGSSSIAYPESTNVYVNLPVVDQSVNDHISIRNNWSVGVFTSSIVDNLLARFKPDAVVTPEFMVSYANEGAVYPTSVPVTEVKVTQEAVSNEQSLAVTTSKVYTTSEEAVREEEAKAVFKELVGENQFNNFKLTRDPLTRASRLVYKIEAADDLAQYVTGKFYFVFNNAIESINVNENIDSYNGVQAQ